MEINSKDWGNWIWGNILSKKNPRFCQKLGVIGFRGNIFWKKKSPKLGVIGFRGKKSQKLGVIGFREIFSGKKSQILLRSFKN